MPVGKGWLGAPLIKKRLCTVQKTEKHNMREPGGVGSRGPLKVGVNPDILKNRECHKLLLNYNCNVYKSIHFWNENDSENPFLISNFTKNDVFLKKWQKISFFGKQILGQRTKNNFE